MSEEYEAGREMDERIAVEVMGYRRLTAREVARGIHANHRYYSTDIAAAWEVVESMGNWRLFQRTNGKWDAEVSGEVAVADTAPLAICRAALKAHAQLTSGSASQEGP